MSTQPDGPPFQGNLTIIWETEKAEISIRLANLEAHALHQDMKICEFIQRLDTDQKVIEDLAQRVKTLEQWVLQREPVTTEIPISEHPLYKKSDSEAYAKAKADELAEKITEMMKTRAPFDDTKG